MNKTTVVLGVSTLAFAGACVFVLHQLRAGQATLKIQDDRIAELEARPSSLAASAAVPQPMPQPVSGPPSAQTAAPQRSLTPQHPFGNAANSPEFRAAYMAQQKYAIRNQLRDIRYWIEIPDETFEALIELEIEYNMARIFAADASQPDPDALAAHRRRVEESGKRREEGLLRILGEENYNHWREWNEASSARSSIRSMNAQLPSAEIVREEDIRAVAMAMANAEQAARGELAQTAGAEPGNARTPAAALERALESKKQVHKSMRAAAATRLSANQLKALDKVLKSELDSMEVSLSLARAMHDANPAR